MRNSFVAATFAIFLAWTSIPSAHAEESSQQSADSAVDAFMGVIVVGGDALGIPITPEEAGMIKDVVACAVDGKQVAECGKEAIVNAVLKEVGGSDASKYLGTFTNCIVGGGGAKDCMSKEIVSQLPEQARPLAQCIADGGNVTDCGKQAIVGEVLSALPKDAQPMGECILMQGKSPGDCAKDFAIKQIPDPDAQKIASCALSGTTTVADCLKQAALSAVPDEAKPLTDCLAKPGADAGSCAKQFAVSQMPDALKPLASCLNDGKSADECAKEAGQGVVNTAQLAATQAALKQLQDLKIDNPGDINRNLPGTVRNIILLAQGIHDGNWEEMILGGGTEVAKLASKIILDVILGPEFAPILGPIVDAFVQDRADLMVDLMNAAAKGDAVKAGEIIFEFYENMFVEAPCALIPDGGFKDATCGNFAKLVAAIANEAGDIVKDILALGKGFLEDIGVWQIGTEIVDAVGGVLDDIGHWLGFGDDDDDKKPKYQPASVCGSSQDYFINNYLTCLTTGADGKASGQLGGMLAGMKSSCTASLSRCYSNAAESCQAMEAALTPLIDRMSDAEAGGAADFVNTTAAAFAAGHPVQACDADFWSGDLGYEFLDNCANSLSTKLNLSHNRCAVNLSLPNQLQGPWNACQAALNNFDRNGLRQRMAATCQQAKADYQASLDRCMIPTRKTPDGKLYNPTGFAWMQAFQECMDNPGSTPHWPDQLYTGFVGIDSPVHFAGIINQPLIRWPGIFGDSPIIFRIPITGGGGSGGINKIEGGGPLTIPTNTKLPPGALKNPGGVLKPPRQVLQAPNPKLKPPPSDGGSGGYYLSRPGSAMDNLGTLNTNQNMNSVIGNSGGADAGRRAPCPTCGQTTTTTAGNKGGTGTGGINKVYPSAPPPPKNPPPKATDPMIDYGGCACNRQDTFVGPK